MTAYDAEQRDAAGDTPSQRLGAPGLPQEVRDNRSLVNRDLVVWLTLGHYHLTVVEAWPVLSRRTLGFEIKPAICLARNPALGLRVPFEWCAESSCPQNSPVAASSPDVKEPQR